jgi:hypothetical protein
MLHSRSITMMLLAVGIVCDIDHREPQCRLGARVQLFAGHAQAPS